MDASMLPEQSPALQNLAILFQLLPTARIGSAPVLLRAVDATRSMSRFYNDVAFIQLIAVALEPFAS